MKETQRKTKIANGAVTFQPRTRSVRARILAAVVAAAVMPAEPLASNVEAGLRYVSEAGDSPKMIVALARRVADYQLAHPSPLSFCDWEQGAFLAGLSAFDKSLPDSPYRSALLQIAEGNGWKLGPRTYHADDICIGQTYLDLYAMTGELRAVAAMRERCDTILAYPSEGSLDWSDPHVLDRWSWCDALFMAPPAWMRLYRATGNSAYMDYATIHWWKTSDFLYDPVEHLFFRDGSFFNKRGSKGEKLFWSRGNGWVFAGLARVIELLPDDSPDRLRFVRQFRDIAERLRGLQQPDGSWSPNLLNPAAVSPRIETSGTGFFCYGFAWGVNHGFLDPIVYLPAAGRAWGVLARYVTPEGKLEHVQPPGDSPAAFLQNSTAPYGPGALLLAASELCHAH